MLSRIQGATILDPAAEASTSVITVKLESQHITLPPPFDPAPHHWIIYNRWTGSYVSDETGSEHANIANAFAFPSEAAAVQFARQTQGTKLAHALAQPPPSDPPSCETCWRPQARGATQCPHCNANLRTVTGWAFVFPLNAAGGYTDGVVTL